MYPANPREYNHGMNRTHLIGLILVMAVILAASCARADTVYLKRGGSLEGKVIENESLVKVKLKDGSTTFNRTEIERIEKSEFEVTDGNAILKKLGVWKDQAVAWTAPAQRGIQNAWGNIKRTTSGWMQPVGRSPLVKTKERQLNDSLMEMQKSLKANYAKEKAAAKAKRDQKKDSFLS